MNLSKTSNNFHIKVYGINLTITLLKEKKIIIISGILDDIIIDCLNYQYTCNKITKLTNHLTSNKFSIDISNRFISCLSLKDLLI